MMMASQDLKRKIKMAPLLIKQLDMVLVILLVYSHVGSMQPLFISKVNVLLSYNT